MQTPSSYRDVERLTSLLPFLDCANQKFIIASALFLPFFLTYLVTLWKFRQVLKSKKKGKAPPTLPFSIPILSHAIPFAWDTQGTISTITKRFGNTVPVRLQLGVAEMTFVSGSDNLLSIWKQSQKLTTKGYRVLFANNMFGFPKSASSFYLADNSGLGSFPHPDSNVPPDHRIDYLTHSSVARFLTGTGLRPLSQRFMRNLAEQLSNNHIGHDWESLSDLYSIFRTDVLRAALKAAFGSYILSLTPEFCQDFWRYDEGLPLLAKGVPRWLTPAPYKARDKCLENIKKWHYFAKGVSPNAKAVNVDDWDPYFGAGVMRYRQELYSKMEAMDADGIASEDLGLIWAANANAIPSAFWFLIETFRSPSLLLRVRSEVEGCLIQSSTAEVAFDIAKLCDNPLLQSVYAETLRLRVWQFVIRSPDRTDLNVGDWLFPKNKLIAISSYTAHMDKATWNTGTDEDPHPIEEFWPDRFIVYPDDSTSGPLKTSPLPQDERPTNLSGPKFSTEGLAGIWIPYGGGQRMCPGRHFAKQEILLTCAMMSMMFDIDLDTPGGSIPESDMRGFGFGAMKPKSKLPCRIRRRVR